MRVKGRRLHDRLPLGKSLFDDQRILIQSITASEGS